MKFTHIVPQDWKELQNLTAEYLITAGYNAITPHTINTARGKVEVDVYISTPNEFVKHIICECKYWNTAVPKEKIHAFRQVVHDSGAELGIFISKSGYQSGAIEAAKFSNIRLETWESFLDNIMDKWIDNKLWEVKTMAARIRSFDDTYDYNVENLKEAEYPVYKQMCNSTKKTVSQLFELIKSDFINDTFLLKKHCLHEQYNSIDECLKAMSIELSVALAQLEKLSVLPNKPDRYIKTMKILTDIADE